MRVMQNRSVGTCFTCRVPVAEGAGYAVPPIIDGGRWKTYCAAHMSIAVDYAPTETPPPAEKVQAMPYDTADQPALSREQIDALLKLIVANTADHWLKHVPAMVASEVAAIAPRELHIKSAGKPTVKIERHHKALPTLLDMVASGESVFLVGPAGSGKTTLAENVATALGRKFYMAARVTSEFKLVGFVDATGKTVRTQFREAYEKGGVFLFDEIDASDPDALTAFNAALANGLGDFPDGMVKRHKDFVAIAAGNTFGRGADRQYVGRNQLDAATLDRFAILEVDYDEALERELAGNAEWVAHVQKVRKAIDIEKVRHIVSPRASIRGAAMLAQGIDRKAVEEARIWKGLPTDARQRVEYRMGVL